MKNMKTGEMIVGNLVEEDLELGEILGNGASGYVYAAVHRPTGRKVALKRICLLYTSPSPRDRQKSRMPSSA